MPEIITCRTAAVFSIFQRESISKGYKFASIINADGSISVSIADEQAEEAKAFVDGIHADMDKAEQKRKETKAQEQKEEIAKRASTTKESTDGKPSRKRRVFSRSKRA